MGPFGMVILGERTPPWVTFRVKPFSWEVRLKNMVTKKIDDSFKVKQIVHLSPKKNYTM